MQRRSRIAGVMVAVAGLASVAGGQAPPLPATGQNPSPMVEATRAHERLVERDIGGARGSFLGPGGRPVDVWWPATNGSTLDLVIHFHGAAWLAQDAASRLERPAATAVVNLGAGSGAYHRVFADPGAFDSLLAGIARTVGRSRWQRIALTGFSAGHGAIRVILREPRHFARVEAVLLLDGMHTSYIPAGGLLATGATLDVGNLQAFEAFARAAMAGQKRFVVTHSEIFPGTFASTTETADHLLQALGLRRTAVLHWGPRGMQQLGEADAGGFSLLSFAGNSAPDHIDHYHAMPEMLARLMGRRE